MKGELFKKVAFRPDGQPRSWMQGSDGTVRPLLQPVLRRLGALPGQQDSSATPALPTPSEAGGIAETLTGQGIHTIPDVLAHVLTLQDKPTHQERTVELIHSPTKVVIVAGYQPGEGEDPHAHPTANILFVLHGSFSLSLRNAAGTGWQEMELQPGHLVNLEPYDEHFIRANENQPDLAVLMVSIVPGLATSDPGYNIPVSY